MRALGRIRSPWPTGLNERFHMELQQVRDFVHMAERHLQSSRETLSAEFKRDTAEMNDDQANDVFMDRYYDYMVLDDVFPRVSARMTFIGIYSLLEHQLMLVCGEIQAVTESPLTVEDRRRSGIDAYRFYCENVAGVPFPTNIPEWWHIQRYRWVRNVIVHANGRLEPGKRSEVREYLKDHPSVELNHNDEIIPSHQFCLDAVDTIERFMNALTVKLLEKFTTVNDANSASPAAT